MRLFLDEQISPVVNGWLRERGIDVVSPHDLGASGMTDLDQFVWPAADGRALVTYNVAYFRLLADLYLSRVPWTGPFRSHFGVSERSIPQRDLGALLRALEALLITYPGDVALLNQIVFLQAIPT